MSQGSEMVQTLRSSLRREIPIHWFSGRGWLWPPLLPQQAPGQCATLPPHTWLLLHFSCRLRLHSTTDPQCPSQPSSAGFSKGAKLVKVPQTGMHIPICRLDPKGTDLWQRTWADLGLICLRPSSWVSFVPLKIFPKSLLLMSSALHIALAWLKTWLKILYWQITISQQIWCIFMPTHWKGKAVFNKVSLVPSHRWHSAFQLSLSNLIWLKIYLFHTTIHILCAYERAHRLKRAFCFAGNEWLLEVTKEGKTGFYFHCVVNMSLATSFSQHFHGELNSARN